MFSMIS